MIISKGKKESFLIILFIMVLIITIGCSKNMDSIVSDDSPKTKTTSSDNLNATIDSTENNDKAQENTDNKYYKLSSQYGTDKNTSFRDLFESEDALSRLKKLNKELKDKFDYWEIEFQPLFYVGYYDKDEKFIYSIDSKNKIAKNDEGEEMYVTGIKTLQMGNKASSKYNKLIEMGDNFSAEDFIINSDGEMVNCILGNNYKEYYNIGDEIPLVLHQKIINFKVIGFYKQGTSVSQYKGNEVKLDNFMIMPFYDINYNPTDEMDDLYQKIYYTQKNEGYIKSENIDDLRKNSERDDFKNLVQNLSNKYNLKYLLISSPVFIKFMD